MECIEYGPEKISPENVPILRTQILAAFTGAWIYIGIACGAGFTGVYLPDFTDPTSEDAILTKEQASLFSSINNVGGLIGGILTGFLNTILGQRITMMIALSIGLTGWMILVFSSNFYLLILSRIFVGIMIGINISACNNYIVEVAYTPIRGRLLAITDVFKPCGFAYLALMGMFNLHWRIVVLFTGIITTIPPFVVLCFLPDSPRWLATKCRKEDSRASLIFYRGKFFNCEKELNEIFKQLEETSNILSVRQQLQFLISKKICKLFVVFSAIMLFIQFTGLIVVTAYLRTIFMSTENSISDTTSVFITSAVRIFGALAYMMLADRVKKIHLFTIPLFIGSVAMAALGLYFFLLSENSYINISWLPLASLIVYLFFAGMYYPVLMLLRSELIPTSARPVGTSIFMILMAIGLFTVTFTYPYMIESIGSQWTYWFYSAAAIFISFLIIRFLPETHGKTLEEIADMK